MIGKQANQSFTPLQNAGAVMRAGAKAGPPRTRPAALSTPAGPGQPRGRREELGSGRETTRTPAGLLRLRAVWRGAGAGCGRVAYPPAAAHFPPRPRPRPRRGTQPSESRLKAERKGGGPQEYRTTMFRAGTKLPP